MPAEIPYVASSLDGSVVLFIPSSGAAQAEVFLEDVGPLPISRKATKALAARWLDPGTMNRLIKQGLLPKKASARARLARLPINFRRDGGVTVGDKAGGGRVALFGVKIWDLTLSYVTPQGVLRHLAGTYKIFADTNSVLFRGAMDAMGDNAREVLEATRLAAKAAEEAAKAAEEAGRGTGFSIGLGFGTSLIILAGVGWLVFGGGAATTGMAAAAAGRKLLK